MPERVEPCQQSRQLLEVSLCQSLDPSRAVACEPKPNHPVVMPVVEPLDQTSGDSSIDEFDRAVVAQQQMLRDLTDRRW